MIIASLNEILSPLNVCVFVRMHVVYVDTHTSACVWISENKLVASVYSIYLHVSSRG